MTNHFGGSGIAITCVCQSVSIITFELNNVWLWNAGLPWHHSSNIWRVKVTFQSSRWHDLTWGFF